MKEARLWLAQKSNQWAGILLLGGFLFRTFIALCLYPGFDESYYYSYTLHPDWSYFDHPPLVALTTGLGIWLTGEVTQFTIRIGTVILYTFTLGFLYLTGCKLFDRKAGLMVLAIATFIPMFQASFGILNLPDSPLIFFWTVALYYAVDEFFREGDRYQPSYRLALISLMVGLACLGKYHGFLLGLGLIGFCLFSPRYRAALTSPWMLLGMGLFTIAIAPIIIWNLQYDWVSFRFQSMRAVPENTFNLLGAFLVWLVSIGYLFPTFGLPLCWVNLKAFLYQFSAQKDTASQDIKLKYQFVLWISLPIIIPFTLMGAYRQVLPSWPMPGYWGATLILGQQAAIWQARSPKLIRLWLQNSVIVIYTLCLIILIHITLGTFQKPSQYPWFGSFLASDLDTSSQLIDIQQLRRGFVQSTVLSSALEKASFVFTQRFFLGGQVAMALVPLGNKPVTTFDGDPRGFAFWSKADEWIGKDALYVTSQHFQKGEDLNAKYGSYFSSIFKIGDVPIYRGGVVVQVFEVYQAKNMLKPYPRPYGNK